MATVPFVYDNNNPIIEPSLSPLQLALAQYMLQGTPYAFAPNQRFLNAMRIFSSSEPLRPITINPDTGIASQPAFGRDIIGIRYEAKGDDIYIYRRAEDCGPDENRYEYAYVGKRADIASGTWTYYALRVMGGTVSVGSFDSRDTGTGGGLGGTCSDDGGMCTA